MNKSILDSEVLKLNAVWQRIGYCSARQAIIALSGGVFGGTRPALALDIEVDGDGKLIKAVPTEWDDWISLPIQSPAEAISSHRGAIRLPRVIVSPEYSQMPVKRPKLSNRAIHERDGWVDQYTGKRLNPEEASVDHVIPQAKGGGSTWTNMVCCKKKRNHTKGSKWNHEAGLKLRKRPVEPKALPMSETIKKSKHPHQIPFFQ